MSKMLRITVMVGLIVAVLAAASGGIVGAANPPAPTYGTADVDGNDGEWDASDYFGDMVNGAGKLGAKLYVRYDCPTGILYVLVKAEPGTWIVDPDDAAEHYVRVDGSQVVTAGSGDDGTPPDFAQISSGTDVVGWEASAYVGQGNHTLYVHTNVYFENESNTAGGPGDPALNLCCGSITIEKTDGCNADPRCLPGTDFSFTASPKPPLWDFYLDDDGDPTLSRTEVFPDLNPDTYQVTEIVPPYWTLQNIVCTADTGMLDVTFSPSGGDAHAPGDNSVQINLGTCQNVTCEFVNAWAGTTSVDVSSFAVSSGAGGLAGLLGLGGLLAAAAVGLRAKRRMR